MIALLVQIAVAAQCTPADYLCNLGRAPTYSEQEAGRMAAQRQEAEREVIERQAAATAAATLGRRDTARELPSEVGRLAADRRCTAAVDAAMRGGDIDLAQQTRASCR